MSKKHKNKEEPTKDKHEVGDPTWKSRQGKTYQDRLYDPGKRERVQEQARRLSWMQKHRPSTSSDWVRYK